MIAHIAAAGEQRGRVVLSVSSGRPSPVAIEAALRVAQAFESEIESLFVEDRQLIEVAKYPFAREVSLSGRQKRSLSPEGIARQMRHVIAALSREIETLARRAEVPSRSTIVSGEQVAELARACAACGPWNVVALAEPLSPGSGDLLRQFFEIVRDATGLIAVGPRARRTTGPIIAAVEDLAHLEPMLRAATRLMPALATESVTALLIGRTEAETVEMEGQARLVLDAESGATIVRAVARHGLAVEVAEILRRTGSGFVFAQFGGLVVPSDHDLRHLVSSLECPLFLMR